MNQRADMENRDTIGDIDEHNDITRLQIAVI